MTGVTRRARRMLREMPWPLAAGLVVLAIGVLVDAVWHLAFHGSSHDGAAPAVVHGVVAVGMGLSLAGVAVSARAGARTDGSTGRRGT